MSYPALNVQAWNYDEPDRIAAPCSSTGPQLGQMFFSLNVFHVFLKITYLSLKEKSKVPVEKGNI